MRIHLRVGASGVLQEVIAEGHAGFGTRGQDIVCAAVSILMRTAARTFEENKGYAVDGAALKRGELHFSVRCQSDGSADWARGVTGMFVKGIDDLAHEFPDHIDLTISKD